LYEIICLPFSYAFFCVSFSLIFQRGPITFDLRAILQKRENLQTTSNKMMCKTTKSPDIEKGR